MINMKKEFKPKPIRLINDYLILYIFIIIILILFYVNKAPFNLYFLFLSVFGFLIGGNLIFRSLVYNELIFDDKKLIIYGGFNKKIKEIILYEQINFVSSTTYGNRLLTHEHLVLNYHNKGQVINSKIYQSFFSNDEFRQIHLEFMKILPSHKIKFDKDYYNL